MFQPPTEAGVGDIDLLRSWTGVLGRVDDGGAAQDCGRVDDNGEVPVDRSSSLLISRSISSNSSSRMLGVRWRSMTLGLEEADQSRCDADWGEKRIGGVKSTVFGTPFDEASDVQRDSGVDDAPGKWI